MSGYELRNASVGFSTFVNTYLQINQHVVPPGGVQHSGVINCLTLVTRTLSP